MNDGKGKEKEDQGTTGKKRKATLAEEQESVKAQKTNPNDPSSSQSSSANIARQQIADQLMLFLLGHASVDQAAFLDKIEAHWSANIDVYYHEAGPPLHGAFSYVLELWISRCRTFMQYNELGEGDNVEFTKDLLAILEKKNRERETWNGYTYELGPAHTADASEVLCMALMTICKADGEEAKKMIRHGLKHLSKDLGDFEGAGINLDDFKD